MDDGSFGGESKELTVIISLVPPIGCLFSMIYGPVPLRVEARSLAFSICFDSLSSTGLRSPSSLLSLQWLGQGNDINCVY